MTPEELDKCFEEAGESLGNWAWSDRIYWPLAGLDFYEKRVSIEKFQKHERIKEWLKP